MPRTTKSDLKKLKYLEEEFGCPSRWTDALFDGFDFQLAYEAGHIYTNKYAQKKLDKILKLVTPEQFDNYFTHDVFCIPMCMTIGTPLTMT
jgi:hypothetical protein